MSHPVAPSETSSPRASEDEDGRYSREIPQEDPILSPASVVSVWDEGRKPKPHSRMRHTIGIILLLATVFLWTASNFLASVRGLDFIYTKL